MTYSGNTICIFKGLINSHNSICVFKGYQIQKNCIENKAFKKNYLQTKLGALFFPIKNVWKAIHKRKQEVSQKKEISDTKVLKSEAKTDAKGPELGKF